MDKKPPIPAEMVNAFVAQAHGNLEQVQTMLAQTPALVNAAWDWGGGDWETALGAAAHTGRREIALFLLENGARMDLFAAAMLGELQIVEAMAAVSPEIVQAKGPHGIPLLVHAQMGGEMAQPVVDFLLAQIESM